MATLPNGFPIFLRSWPTKSADSTDLPTLFQRIHNERGGFSSISEESLREEIAKEESGEVLEEESEDEEDKSDEDIKARAAAKQELLQQITTAHHSALNSLNFVSLLLSKSNPAAVSATISPELRDLIPLGTLGATKASSPWITQEKKDDNKNVAKGWKTRDVNKSIDSILDAATRLESEIQKETTYWEEILSLHDKGWSVSKVPRRKGVLGVRLGSSEAPAVLKSQGLATLTRSEFGSVRLTPNPTTSSPKTLRVRIQVNDEVTGTSKIPLALPQSATVSAQVLQTRNTLFALELWHELNRESRTLGSFNISSRDDTLLFPLTSTKTAILDLHTLPTSPEQTHTSHSDESRAQALYLALNLLLSYSHRQSLRNRSKPPKPKPNPRKPPTTSGPAVNKLPNYTESPTLLRPLLTLLNHQSSLDHLHNLFSFLTCTVSKTSLRSTESRYTINPTLPTPPPFLAKAEKSIAILTHFLTATVSFKILEDAEIRILVTTRQTHLPTSIFNVQIHPEGAELGVRCPSPGVLTEVNAVEEYVLFVSAAAMALRFSFGYHIASALPSSEDQRDQEAAVKEGQHVTKEEEKAKWNPTHNPSTLQLSCPTSSLPSKNDGKLLHFSLHRITSHRSPTTPSAAKRNGMKLRVTYTFSPAPSQAIDTSALIDGTKLEEIVNDNIKSEREKNKEGKKTGGREGEGFYEWVVWEDEDVGKEKDDVEEVVKSLEDVVEEAKR